MGKPKLDALVAHFVEKGWARLDGAFGAARARPVVARALARWKALPPPPAAPDAVPRSVCVPSTAGLRVADFAPRAWELIAALAGGEDAIEGGASHTWSDGFVIAAPRAKRWLPPSRNDFGWHVDGPADGIYRLDSREVGLVVYSLWSEVKPRGGGTFLAPGALPGLARYLAARPKGVSKHDFPAQALLDGADPRYFEFSGPVGSVLVTHPLMLHAASFNASARPRVMGVRVVPLARRPDHRRGTSPLERATRRALEKGAR